MKQKSWPESAEQRGVAWRSGPADEGPRTHEDGGARGAPRRRAGLQPMGRKGERGPPVGRRGRRFTIPLHKASHRAADTSNAVPVAALRVATWKTAVARSRLARAGCRTTRPMWIGGGCARGRDAPGVRQSALGSGDERRESALYGWSRVETGATMAGDESSGGTTNTTHHD